MTETEALYVLLDPEVQDLLDTHETNLAQLLETHGLSVQQSFAQDPTQGQSGYQSKDLVAILIASASVIAAITPALSTILNTLTHRPIVIKHKETVVVEDSQGNIVRNTNGDPLLQENITAQIVEPKPQKPEEYSVRVKLIGIIDISFESKKR